jgi:uncharacterized cupin superfamily protein
MIEALVAQTPSSIGAHVVKPTAVTPGMTEALAEFWASGLATVGFWECTEGEFTARRDGYSEVCHLLSGEVSVVTTGGATVRIGPGDTLVMPSGWVGSWIVHAPVRKLYIIISDAPSS